MKKTFSVKNWEELQHYKDRNPPWIKLHSHLLDDYEFEMLGDAAKGHLLCIMMLASRTKNEMPYDEKWVSKKIGSTSKVDLDALVDAGFLNVEHNASTLQHNKTQCATVSVPLEEERRVEAEKSRADNRRFSPPTDIETISYFESKGSDRNEAEKFWCFYSSKNWMVGRNKMKNWHSSASGWIKRNKGNGSVVEQSANTNWENGINDIF